MSGLQEMQQEAASGPRLFRHVLYKKVKYFEIETE